MKNPEDPEEDTHWEEFSDISKFGPVCEIDLNRTWSNIQVPDMTSPPSGRMRYLLKEKKERKEEKKAKEGIWQTQLVSFNLGRNFAEGEEEGQEDHNYS